METNAILSRQVEDQKGLQEQAQAQQKKLKEKDRIIEQLVKAQVRKQMTSGTEESKSERANAGSFISDKPDKRRSS